MKTNMASSYTSSPRYVNDTDYDDVDSLDLDDDRDFDENFTDEGKYTKLLDVYILMYSFFVLWRQACFKHSYSHFTSFSPDLVVENSAVKFICKHFVFFDLIFKSLKLKFPLVNAHSI